MNNKHEEVKNYYGDVLQSNEDLSTNACCTIERPPFHIREILADIHDEVITKYYGCGLTIPNQIKGLSILDLGSGSGRDCYIASKLVGEYGNVIGIDMTGAQLEVANKHIEYHTAKFGYKKPNTQFLKGNIDELGQLSIEENSVDVIISNCVINLCLDKQKVLNDAFKLLKPGGEIYFSDVYCNRRIPKELQSDRELWGECLSGALYWNDFLSFAKKAGFTDPRVMEDHPIAIENEELEAKLQGFRFYSVTYRLFKIDGLESDCEDYGQAVKYKGTIDYNPNAFDLDNHHHFPRGKVMTVCGNTYKMLHDTRFKNHFDFYGDWSTHYGIFEGCGTNMPFNESEENGSNESCC